MIGPKGMNSSTKLIAVRIIARMVAPSGVDHSEAILSPHRRVSTRCSLGMLFSLTPANLGIFTS